MNEGRADEFVASGIAGGVGRRISDGASGAHIPDPT